MKKVFEFIGWALFIIAGLVGVFAALCTLGGVIGLVMTLYSTKFALVLAYCAFGYFVAIAVLLIMYLIVSVYWAIENAVSKR